MEKEVNGSRLHLGCVCVHQRQRWCESLQKFKLSLPTWIIVCNTTFSKGDFIWKCTTWFTWTNTHHESLERRKSLFVVSLSISQIPQIKHTHTQGGGGLNDVEMRYVKQPQKRKKKRRSRTAHANVVRPSSWDFHDFLESSTQKVGSFLGEISIPSLVSSQWKEIGRKPRAMR